MEKRLSLIYIPIAIGVIVQLIGMIYYPDSSQFIQGIITLALATTAGSVFLSIGI